MVTLGPGIGWLIAHYMYLDLCYLKITPSSASYQSIYFVLGWPTIEKKKKITDCILSNGSWKPKLSQEIFAELFYMFSLWKYVRHLQLMFPLNQYSVFTHRKNFFCMCCYLMLKSSIQLPYERLYLENLWHKILPIWIYIYRNREVNC